MRLVKPMMRDSAMSARDALTMATGPRAGTVAPGLTFAQEFLRCEPLCRGPVLVAINGHRLDRAD